MKRKNKASAVLDRFPPTLSLDEVAVALGDSAVRLRRMSWLGQFPKLIRVNGQNYRVLLSDFQEWCRRKGIPFGEAPEP